MILTDSIRTHISFAFREPERFRILISYSAMNRRQKIVVLSGFLISILGVLYVPVGTPTTYGRNLMAGYRWVWSTEEYVVNTGILYVHLALVFILGVILFSLLSKKTNN